MENHQPNLQNGRAVPETLVPVTDEPVTRRASAVTVTEDRQSSEKPRASILQTILRPINYYISGDCPGISKWVDKQPDFSRKCLYFIESIFRTFGALIFVNNVWSGVLFFVACMIHTPFGTVLGVLGIVVSFGVGLLLNVPQERLRNGVATFNGFMVASFIGVTALPFARGIVWNPWLVFPAVFFSAVSTVIKSALHSILQHVKIPALNLPFSITTLCFLASQGSTVSPIFPATLSAIPPGQLITNGSIPAYEWPQIVRGIFFAISNIYGCDNVTSVILAWLAVLLASPLLFVMCLLGSCTGTGVAVVLGVSDDQLATGMWSFNSLLVCGSVGGFFYVWNTITCLLAVFAAAFACVVAGTLYHILGVACLPFQALPLFITDAIFILALTAYGPRCFAQVEFADIRFPEQHRRDYLARKKIRDSLNGQAGTLDVTPGTPLRTQNGEYHKTHNA